MCKLKCFWILLALLIISPLTTDAQSAQELSAMLKNGGLYAETLAGREVLNIRGDKQYIPASTQKVITSLCALKILGAEYRFKTEFYTDQQGSQQAKLYVRGFGDPTLTSEEIKSLAQVLASKIKQVSEIVLDLSAFSSGIKLDGASNTLNPYDAPTAPLVANFNTANLKRLKNGELVSAEPQTPLTNLARQAARAVGASPTRINLGGDEIRSSQYFGEILQIFLKQAAKKAGGQVSGPIRVGTVPKTAQKIYLHQSKPLPEVLQGLLEYSTNFTANQVFLVSGAESYGYPATPEKGRKAIHLCLDKLGITGPVVEEGSGLSRKNKISPRELVSVLRQFESYQKLLKLEEGKFLAKTGTLTGVCSYAGYSTNCGGKEIRFAILINDQVSAEYRMQVARKLLAYADKNVSAIRPSN